ncbi:MAG TPA: protein kinase, partial [Pseudomonadota bacterium]|nr:protein kinase [Pseudomonadota bacterium]
RDLKPDNVLLGRDGRVVITDFGIARGVEQREQEVVGAGLLGTPEYMAPEQVDGSAEVSPATDLFALGVTLFEMLTGTLPFVASTPMLTAMARLLRDAPDPRSLLPQLPGGLCELILRCLRRNPLERPQSAAELATLLAQFLPTRKTLQPTGTPPVKELQRSEDDIALSRQKSIAVLPLRNLSNPQDSHLAEGLTEELIDALSATKGVRVRSRGATMSVKGDSREPRVLGKELGVQLVVDGSLRRSGDTLRLTVRLIYVEDGVQVWAQRFDANVGDLFALSDTVSTALAQALTSQISGAPEKAKLSDALAVEKYFRARQLLHTAASANLNEAVVLLEEIMVGREHDPKLLASYATAQARRWFFGEAQAADKARAAAELALQTAPSSAESCLALAVVRFQDANLPGAVLLLRQALARSPTLAEAHDLLGRILIETGPLQEGMRAIEIALDIDPSLVRLRVERARLFELQGQHDKADGLILQTAANPHTAIYTTALRCRIALWRKDRAYARRMLKELEGSDTFPGGMREIVEAVAYERDLDAALLGSKLPIRSGSQRGMTLFHQLAAEWHAFLNRPAETLKSLTPAVNAGLVDLVWLHYCPLFQPLFRDAQFQHLYRIVEERARQVHAALTSPLP